MFVPGPMWLMEVRCVLSGSMPLMEERCACIRTDELNGGEMNFMMLEQACIIRSYQEFCEHQSSMSFHDKHVNTIALCTSKKTYVATKSLCASLKNPILHDTEIELCPISVFGCVAKPFLSPIRLFLHPAWYGYLCIFN